MLRLTDINRKLSDQFSLSGITIEIPEGDYYVLLGRSGSGKTQLLELIAGLEKPDSGKIILDGSDITYSRIQERKIGIVFQDYAIFPHMTVYGNIAYPMRSRKIQESDIRETVYSAAKQMNIEHLLNRGTTNLSGGERQRIALARTLVTSPRLLLLDEPLSSLDASLKDEMKRLLRRLNREGQTIIHVTHDYSDAISLANRVGVIHNGRIIQEGPVREVFSRPVNRFVARYAGFKNFFRLKINGQNGVIKGITGNKLEFILPGNPPGGECLAVLKNENISVSRLRPEGDGKNIFRGKIEELIPAEHGIELTVNAGETFYIELPARYMEEMQIRNLDEVWISFDPGEIIIISGQTD